MKNIKNQSRSEESKLLSVKEVCDILGITLGTIYTWRSTQRFRLPCIKIGRLLKFRHSDVMKFIKESEKGSNE